MKLHKIKSTIKKVSLISLMFFLILLSMPLYGAMAKDQPQTEHTLPILKVVPTANATVVRPDTPIQLVLDANAATYKRFREQFEKGFVQYTINGQEVQGKYDQTTKTVVLEHNLLDRYRNYKVCAIAKADMHNANNGSDNTEYCYSFMTGSALHEATNFIASVEAPQVLVTDGGSLNVKAIDDYGLPATHATVTVTGNSTSFSAPTLLLNQKSNGQGVIPLKDHVKQIVTLTTIAQDNIYHDPSDTNKVILTEEFLAGPPNHIHLAAETPLTVGKSEPLTGTVYDVFNNNVEDNSIVAASSTSGTIIPQQQNTKDGSFSFTFNAPVLVQDVKLTAASGIAKESILVHLQADQPSVLQLKPLASLINLSQEDKITLTVKDQYGNSVPNTKVALVSTGHGKVPAFVTTDANGQAVFSFADDTSEIVTIVGTSPNGAKGIAQVEIHSMSNLIILWSETILEDGSIEFSGILVDEYGHVCPNYGFSVNEGATTNSVITDGYGKFSFIVNPSSQTGMTVSVPGAANAPKVVIVPSQTGSSLVDSGVGLAPNQIIQISRPGVASVNGIQTSLQNFTTVQGGELFLGQQSGSGRWTIISIQDPCEHFHLKILKLKANPDSIHADGKSTTTVSGELVEYSSITGKIVISPVIDGKVNIGVPSNNGKVTQSIINTDVEGNFTAMYTAGSTVGQVSIVATYGNVQAVASVNLVRNCVFPSIPGVEVPAGTTASASSAYYGAPASAAIDGCWTSWNSGGYSGTIQLNFPNPTTINGIEVVADSLPSTNEIYYVYGLKDGKWVLIANPTLYIPSPNPLISPISVTEGSYSAIKISINGMASWVAINEIRLIVPQK